MKYVKKIISSVLSLIMAISVISLPVKAEDTEVLLFDDFESGNNGWKLDRAVVKDGMFVFADNVKAANGSLASKAERTIGHTSENDTSFVLNFDVRPGKNLTTYVQVNGLKGAVMPIVFDKSGEICVNSYGISEADSRTFIPYSHETWYTIHTTIDQKAKTMVTTVYDRESGDIVFQRQYDNYLPMKSWPDIMSGGIRSLSIQTNMGNSDDYTPVYVDNFTLKTIPMSLKIETGKTGDVFGRKDKEEFSFTIYNSYDGAYECVLEWEVNEQDLGFIKKGSETFTIEAAAEKNISIEADIQRYGLFTFDAVLSCYKDGQLVETCDKRRLYFSKVLSSDGETWSGRHGFATNDSYGGADEQYELMEMIGSYGARRGIFSWDAVQALKDGPFDYTFNVPGDERMRKSKLPGNVFFLGYGNTRNIAQVDIFGNPGPKNYLRPPVTDEEIERFGNYVDYVIERSGDYIDTYEIWNEFSGSTYSNVYGGGLLAKMTKEVYERVKAKDPTAMVLSLGSPMTRDSEFVREFFEADGHKYCDGLTIHPYHGANYFPHDGWLEPLQNIKDIMDEFGVDLPVYHTELGMSLTLTHQEYGEIDFVPVDEYFKGRMAVQANFIMLAHDLGDYLYTHIIKNIGIDPNEREHQFGFITADGDYRGDNKALPGFAMVAAMNKLFPGKIVCEDMIEKNERAICAYNIRREDDTNIAVLWSTETARNISLDLGCEQVDAYDEYGNHIETIYSANGQYDFGLSDKIMYVEGAFTKFEETDAIVSHSESQYMSTVNDEVHVKISDKLCRNGSIEVEYNNTFMGVIQNDGLKNGEAIVKLNTRAASIGTYPINIRVYDGEGRCIYTAQNHVEIGEPVSVRAVHANYFDDDNRWGLEITITNNANIASVKGTAKITGPDHYISNNPERTFVSIPPKSSETVYINFPELLKKETTTVKGEVCLDYGYSVSFEQYVDFSSAHYAENKPVIDGVISDNEWSGFVLSSTQESNYFPLDKNQKWTGADDCSLNSMNMMWDEENLYLAAVVKDDVYVETPSTMMVENVNNTSDAYHYLWQYDSIQFGIEDEYFNSGNRLLYPFTEIGLARSDIGAFAYCFSGQTEETMTGIIENCEVEITVSEGEIIYECKIPWSKIRGEGYVPDESLIYSFAALVNDNDGNGRKGYMQFNDGIGNGKKVEKFGQMKLMR